MRKKTKELMIEGFLNDNNMDLEDLRAEASSELRKSLKGTEYEIPLKCGECESKLLYSSDRDNFICPFCED